MQKRRKQLKPIEPDVLNTDLMFLTLSDEFKIVAAKARFRTFQEIIDNSESAIINASVFGAVLESQLFEYEEYHGFIDLQGLE